MPLLPPSGMQQHPTLTEDHPAGTEDCAAETDVFLMSKTMLLRKISKKIRVQGLTQSMEF